MLPEFSPPPAKFGRALKVLPGSPVRSFLGSSSNSSPISSSNQRLWWLLICLVCNYAGNGESSLPAPNDRRSPPPFFPAERLIAKELGVVAGMQPLI